MQGGEQPGPEGRNRLALSGQSELTGATWHKSCQAGHSRNFTAPRTVRVPGAQMALVLHARVGKKGAGEAKGEGAWERMC